MKQAQHSGTESVSNALRTLTLATATCLSLFPSLALAHHDMDGDTPMTFMQGLTSGVAHPIIGVDHLVVLLLLGALCGSLKIFGLPVAVFAGTTVIGCFLHMSRFTWPLAEMTLAVSVAAAGPLAWMIARRDRRGMLTLFALFGVLHGYAYGESMVGAGVSPVAGYLIGFVAIQFTVVWMAAKLAARLGERDGKRPSLIAVHVLSVACLCVGAIGLLA